MSRGSRRQRSTDLRNGDTYARPAAGSAIGTSTAWRYVRETADLLATLAGDVHAAVLRACRPASGRTPAESANATA